MTTADSGKGRGREVTGEFMARGAGCLNWACPDPWGAEVGNHPGLPDRITGKCGERGAIRRNIRGTAARPISSRARLPEAGRARPAGRPPGRNEPTFWSRENRRAPTDV